MIQTIKETLLTGSQAFSLMAGDKIILKVKEEKILDYEVPAGKTGTVTVSVDGKILEI